MSEQARTKLAFVGVGAMGQCAHLQSYATLQDRCEIVGIAELKHDMAQQVAARYGVKNVYNDYDEMMKDQDVDGIVASQPFDRHGVLLGDLLKYKVPIFIEKPLAASVEVGEGIVPTKARTDVRYVEDVDLPVSVDIATP